MGLSNDKIQEILKSSRSQEEINRGIRHQNRLRFHSDTTIQKTDFREAYREYIDWIGVEAPEILPKDKFARFLHLLRAPIPTIELTESIYSRLLKVFHSQDSFFNYEFTSPELKSDWEDFREKHFWETKGFHAMQSAIDSVWIADIPEIQTSSRPEPANRLVDLEFVFDIKNDENLNCIYLIYKSGDEFVVYDDETIRVFTKNALSLSVEPIFTLVHGLGYTPARQFWSQQLNSRNFINKESPITKELSDLDWLLFHMTSKKHMDLANSYPKEFYYDFDKDYQDPTQTENKDRDELQKKSLGHEMAGAGTIGVAPAPKGPDDFDMLKNPAVLISPDVKTLEWHVDEETRLQNKIYRSVVGVDQETINDVAKNEKQVDSAFESQLSVLFRVKKNFEIIQKFGDSTLARIRYGDSFIQCQIDYGSKFFLKDVNELHEDFKIAKEAGASEPILEQIQTNLLNTKYRQDHRLRQRAEIIRDLNPLPEKTLDEAIKILKNTGISKINFVIKANLTNFVRRFEIENIGLTEFASNIDYQTKIKTILNKFKEYASEFSTGNQDQGD